MRVPRSLSAPALEVAKVLDAFRAAVPVALVRALDPAALACDL